jgi:RNA polymerase sigma factor (TIGR02999 family)
MDNVPPPAPESDDTDAILLRVYDDLRRRARSVLAAWPPGQTLTATDLVHEAYARLAKATEPQSWNGDQHFFRTVVRAMGHILIDRARHKAAPKVSGGLQRVNFDPDLFAVAGPELDKMLALAEALDALAAEEPALAELARLRLFGGLSVGDAATVLGTSRAKAYRDWSYTFAWLRARLGETENRN